LPTVSPVMIDVLVADWQPLFRDGVVRVIRQDSQLRLVAEATDAAAALCAIRRHHPAVAVVAADPDDAGGERLLARVRHEGLTTRIVLLTADPHRSAWDAIGTGAAGVLSRRVTPDAVRSAVRSVARGGIALCDEAQEALAGEIRARRPSEGPLLTAREQEILDLVADGLSAPAIARRLQIATTTVRTHIQHLYEKLDAHDRGRLIRHAMRRNLLD
jgi:two-component system nitrate/nitrite response regulator NarL